MATSYRLKRKLYSDDNNGGMSTTGKILTGIGTAAATLYGAKKGLFGNTARMAVNKQYMSLGNALGSKSMVKSGATDYAKAAVKKNISQAQKINPNFKMTNQEIQRNIAKQRSYLVNNAPKFKM